MTEEEEDAQSTGAPERPPKVEVTVSSEVTLPPEIQVVKDATKSIMDELGLTDMFRSFSSPDFVAGVEQVARIVTEIKNESVEANRKIEIVGRNINQMYELLQQIDRRVRAFK